MKKSISAFVAVSLLFAAFSMSVHAARMESHSGSIQTALSVSDAGELTYEVLFNGNLVVLPSKLGITVDGVDLGENVTIGKPTAFQVNDSYRTRGNHRVAQNRYLQWCFPVTHNPSSKEYQLEVRLYDDGVAYRYLVPGQGTQHVNGESSSWAMPSGCKTWFFERNSYWKLMSYAGVWMSADADEMESISSEGPVQGTPLVFELPDAAGYAAVTKAALYNYSGMRLKAVGDRTFEANFTEGDEGFDVAGSIITPWRVTMLADNLNDLVNSDLIENLNPEPDAKLFANTDYIQPGRSVWSWMSMRLGTVQDQIDFVDQAADLGFEYSIIDDGWKEWPNPWETVANIAERGAKKRVRVWVWVHSKDIKDPANDYQQMREYLDKVRAAGICGVKTDFMNSESKEFIDFEIRFLQMSAERELLVNFHGCHSATGESRTYPNELTREGIRGIEVNLHKKSHLPPSHNAALPFTRMLVGHGDYTPLYYTNPGPTTYAHQLAMPIMLLSPIQIYADHPEILKTNPNMKPGLNVLKAIPTVWDETIVLEGSKIGELAAFARRSGDDWFVAIINDETPTDYELDLSFLPKGNYAAEVVEDDLAAPFVQLEGLNEIAVGKLETYKTAVPFKVSKRKVKSGKTLNVTMASGGGFVAVFRKR